MFRGRAAATEMSSGWSAALLDTVDGRLAVAGDQADFVAEAEPVGGGGEDEAAVVVGGAFVSGGGLVADHRRPRLPARRAPTTSPASHS